ncbi:MAG: hypothetical protein ABSH56_27530 [Bryobacteraceae bacterium]
MKIRSRKFNGRCSRHKRYNPAIDGLGGIKGGCPRCTLMLEIWEASLRINQLIRRWNPSHDDLERPKQEKPQQEKPWSDPRQLSLIPE